MPYLLPYLLLCLLWAAYFAVHSVLAAKWVKNALIGLIPALKHYYRIGFNIIALGTLLPVVWFTVLAPVQGFKSPPPISGLGLFIILVGLQLLYSAFRSFNLREFVGIGYTDVGTGSSRLVRSGMYAWVRHPLYFSLIVISLGTLLLLPMVKVLLVCLVMYVYLIIGSKLEEAKLKQEFGDAYGQYQKEVKALIPYVY